MNGFGEQIWVKLKLCVEQNFKYITIVGLLTISVIEIQVLILLFSMISFSKIISI